MYIYVYVCVCVYIYIYIYIYVYVYVYVYVYIYIYIYIYIYGSALFVVLNLFAYFVIDFLNKVFCWTLVVCTQFSVQFAIFLFENFSKKKNLILISYPNL